MKEQCLAIYTRKDALFVEERPTIFHLSQSQTRRSAQLIPRLLVSSGVLETNGIDIIHAMATFLSLRYDDMTVNSECISCMEQEVRTVVPPDMREDLWGVGGTLRTWSYT
jgi:hypothetical protein